MRYGSPSEWWIKRRKDRTVWIARILQNICTSNVVHAAHAHAHTLARYDLTQLSSPETFCASKDLNLAGNLGETAALKLYTVTSPQI